MKKLTMLFLICIGLFSCGTNSQEQEKKKLTDSLNAEIKKNQEDGEKEQKRLDRIIKLVKAGSTEEEATKFVDSVEKVTEDMFK